MRDSRFVKAARTDTSAINSRSAIDKMLRRYGASAISMSENIERREIVVSFIIPDSGAKDAQKVPVRLPVNVYLVYNALYGRPKRWKDGKQVTDPLAYDIRRIEQAERVAWRNLSLWIDAALSAAVIGLQSITEAFFAHAVVGAGGERMIEVVEQQQAQLGAGVQRLLTETTGAES